MYTLRDDDMTSASRFVGVLTGGAMGHPYSTGAAPAARGCSAPPAPPALRPCPTMRKSVGFIPKQPTASEPRDGVEEADGRRR